MITASMGLSCDVVLAGKWHPITLAKLLKPRFWENSEICLLYIHINNNKFTNDKFKSAKVVDMV